MTADKDAAGPDSLELLLPSRLKQPAVVDAAGHDVLLTDNFIMVRFKDGAKGFKAAAPVRIVFKGGD